MTSFFKITRFRAENDNDAGEDSTGFYQNISEIIIP